MLTKFGQLMRTIRNEHGMKMGEMANNVGVTPSYLSSIETGKRQITDDLVLKVIDYFDRIAIDFSEEAIRDAAALSKSNHKIMLGKNASATQQEAVAMFARRLETDSLDSETAKKIIAILNSQ